MDSIAGTSCLSTEHRCKYVGKDLNAELSGVKPTQDEISHDFISVRAPEKIVVDGFRGKLCEQMERTNGQ